MSCKPIFKLKKLKRNISLLLCKSKKNKKENLIFKKLKENWQKKLCKCSIGEIQLGRTNKTNIRKCLIEQNMTTPKKNMNRPKTCREWLWYEKGVGNQIKTCCWGGREIENYMVESLLESDVVDLFMKWRFGCFL